MINSRSQNRRSSSQGKDPYGRFGNMYGSNENQFSYSYNNRDDDDDDVIQPFNNQHNCLS